MNKPTNTLHRKRLADERRFKCYGYLALTLALMMLFILLGTLVWRGIFGFVQTEVRIPVMFDAASLALEKDEQWQDLSVSRYTPLVLGVLKVMFPTATEEDTRELQGMLGSSTALTLYEKLQAHPQWFGTKHYVWVPASAKIDYAFKTASPDDEALTPKQQQWMKELFVQDALRTRFNSQLFKGGDSRQAERAGFLGAVIGSLLTVTVCIALAFPLGVMTAVYLEEFARRGRLMEWIEVNINNLAAVPSIVFGLLGLAVFLTIFGMPRSAPLVGGFTLALMVLPVIIIATRTALSAVPDSIRHGALALGASPLQVVWHHTLPLALPGIMTGTILAVARALGETAPLLMIGMVAFVADIPNGFLSPATVMPVQVYLWAGSPEAGFSEKTSAGILILLAVLLALNALAIYIRKKFEVRW